MFGAENRDIKWRRLVLKDKIPNFNISLHSTEISGDKIRVWAANEVVKNIEPELVSITSMSNLEALALLGLPEVPNTTPLEELRILLRYAAEIEHGLMVQYLYALYAITNNRAQGILKGIAIEEMGHLVTVLNLLIATGTKVHLSRYDWNGSKTFDPMEFELVPVSPQSIARLAMAEMPDKKHVDPEDRVVLEEIIKEAGIVDPTKLHRVGLLYMKIYWLLRKDDKVLENPSDEPWAEFPVDTIAASFPGRHILSFPENSNVNWQALPSHWKRNFPTLIARNYIDRLAALTGIADISAQGEGFAQFEDTSNPGSSPGGHFDRLVEVFKIVKSNSSDTSAPVPVNPTYETPTSGIPSVNQIKSDDGIRFAMLGDIFYEITLLTVALYYAIVADPQANNSPQDIATISLDSMVNLLALIGDEITAVELTDETNNLEKVAALCFQKPDKIINLTTGGLYERIFELVEDGKKIAQDLSENGKNEDRRDIGLDLLDELESFDILRNLSA